MGKEVRVIKGDTALRRINGNIVIAQKRVVAYCRVSTDDKDQINSYKSQVEHYTKFIKENKDWILVDIYADEAITGTKVDKRLEFQRLINDCLNGEIDMVITKSISRFARNTLFFEEENINTLTMDGELLLTILSSVAQQEVENISANIKKGLKMKMQRGELVGFQGCMGYDYDKETKILKINHEEAKVVRYIFERYVEGAGGKVISRELKEQGYLSPRGKIDWKESTVLGIIKNEKYKGDLLLGKTFTVDPISKRRLENFGEEDKYYIEGHHEAIVSSEIFEKAQEIRLRRAKGRNTVANQNGKREKYSRAYAFSSMLECGFCGSVLSRRTWHSGSRYNKVIWQYVNFIKNGKSSCPHCKGIEEKAIEKAFLESYKQICYHNEDITQDFLKTVKDELEDNTLDKDLKKVTSKLNQLLKKEKELVNLKLDGVIDSEVYQEKYNEIQKSKSSLIDEKSLLEITLKDEISVKNRLLEFKKTLENYELLEEFDRTVFESIVDKILVGKIEDDGTYSPHKICIIYKTGKNDFQNTKLFKAERKNAKQNKLCSLNGNETEKLCSCDSENSY